MTSASLPIIDGAAVGGPLPTSTQVLVAGGGPVGLALAVELGRRGIHCLVVEPRVAVSQARPRCKTVNVRTMEHLRRWGLADALRERAPLPVAWSRDVVFCTSLAGHELSRFTGVLGLATDRERYPEPGQQAPQYVLEDLLRTAVDELDTATLATGVHVEDLEQDVDAVRATVTDGAGRRVVVTADYLVGADGPRSTVRSRIGSAYTGGHALRPNFGMVFRAPGLWQSVRHGPAVQFWTVNPTAPALMGPIDRTGTWWIIAFGVDREAGERDAQRLVDAVAGTPVEAEVLSTDPWTAHMQQVDRLRRDRVFLAGDAAHLNPPFGGHGLNTGIGDAVDLGWKLAAVLDGWGGPALLDSYPAERRPVQEQVIKEATANMQVLSTELLSEHLDADGAEGERARKAAGAQIQATKHAEFHALDLVLDIVLDGSPIVVPDAAPAAGRPGSRLPHAWLGDEVSLYDRLGTGLTLLVLAEQATSTQAEQATSTQAEQATSTQAEQATSIQAEQATPAQSVHAVEAAARAGGIPLTTLDLRGRLPRDRYGADLVLVRPDQHVAWRGDRAPADPGALLDRLRGATPHHAPWKGPH